MSKKKQKDTGVKSITVSYNDNSRWSEVVSQFLVELSKAYGYPIDEYSLIPFVWEVRQDRLGKLIDNGPASKIVNREFMQVVQRVVDMKIEANRMRADYEKVLAALAPTKRETTK
jgi:hypothetical protein